MCEVNIARRANPIIGRHGSLSGVENESHAEGAGQAYVFIGVSSDHHARIAGDIGDGAYVVTTDGAVLS